MAAGGLLLVGVAAGALERDRVGAVDDGAPAAAGPDHRHGSVVPVGRHALVDGASRQRSAGERGFGADLPQVPDRVPSPLLLAVVGVGRRLDRRQQVATDRLDRPERSP